MEGEAANNLLGKENNRLGLTLAAAVVHHGDGGVKMTVEAIEFVGRPQVIYGVGWALGLSPNILYRFSLLSSALITTYIEKCGWCDPNTA